MRLAVVTLFVVVLLVSHQQTFASMVGTWWSNTTYNHGFFIPVIAAYFAWLQRHEARATHAAVWWPGLLAIAGASLVWLIANLVSVQVVAQLASVALIGGIVLTIAGPRQVSVFALPITYLFFMVPVGQGIVPLLMDWTADFTVFALQVFGFPVFRDGLYFSTTAGNFEVAEACSGIRYLLASIAAGVAFAFVTYTQWKKRALFIAAAIIVPIIANGLRALGIVLIAHYSDMRMAAGVDHFVYGWVFFGIIIFLLFIVGGFFADEMDNERRPQADPKQANGKKPDVSRIAISGGIALVIVLAAPAFVEYRNHNAAQPRPELPVTSGQSGSWSGPFPAELAWQLGYIGADAEASASYSDGSSTVEVRIAAYGDQQQGAELINSQNRVASDGKWLTIDLGTISTGSPAIPRVRSAQLVAGPRSYTVWYWYQQGSKATPNIYVAKWLEVLAIFSPTPAMVVAIAAESSDGEAVDLLTAFIQEFAAALPACAAGSGGADCIVPATTSSVASE